MSKVTSHRDLIVWQKAMNLAADIYRLSSRFPLQKQYRMTHQITRAAISVPANIAEGYTRSATLDYARFLSIAKGSLMEVETFLQLAVRLSHLTAEDSLQAFSLITEISKMLTALRNTLLQQAK